MRAANCLVPYAAILSIPTLTKAADQLRDDMFRY
jgi:hypothetical protein